MVKLERMVGYCGIICSDCPVFIATKKNEDAERKRVPELFTRRYGRKYTPEDINCDGCVSDSPRIFHYCNVCEKRECAKEKSVKNCAYCPEYPFVLSDLSFNENSFGWLAYVN